MSQLTVRQLQEIMPHAKKRAEHALPIINKVAFEYDITTQHRLAAWAATLAAESGELKYQEEIASGVAYEGRTNLGNTQKGDGRRFKGRGRIQITGRDNYQSYTDYLKKNKHLPFVDFIAEPHKLAQEPYATDSAGWFFAVKIHANPLADAGQFLAIQVKVNGRNKKTKLPNHWPVRNAYYKRGLSVLPKGFQLTAPSSSVLILDAGAQAPPPEVFNEAPADSRPLLHAGSRGPAVESLQKILDQTVDGKFGPKTELAVKDFQMENGLDADGDVGPETWAALLKDSKPEHLAPNNEPTGAASTENLEIDTPLNSAGQSAEQVQASSGSASVEIDKEGGIKAEQNKPIFEAENKTMTAPARDGSESSAKTMTILGIAVPVCLVPIFTAIKDLFTEGVLDMREILGSLITFLKDHWKYVFILIAVIIAVMLVKKAFKQITFLLQMYINARADMHNVTVQPAPDAPPSVKSWWQFWK